MLRTVKRATRIAFASVMLAGCVSVSARLPDDIRRQAQERIDEGYHLATVIGVVDATGERYFGFGSLTETVNTPPDKNTIFEIGSITKIFTSTLLADLQVNGVVDLQEPIEKYLPVFSNLQQGEDDPITLEQLSVHTSGLPREPLNMDGGDDDRYATYTSSDLKKFLSDYRLNADNHGSYQYSNLGVLVLELAIEEATGRTYEALTDERVIRVLGMSDTFFDIPASKRPRLAAPFRYGQPVGELDVGEFQAMGGLRSTARDMLQFLRAELGLKNTSLRPAFELSQKSRYADDEIEMGLGWHILRRAESGKTIHYHTGGTNGYVSFAGFDRDARVGVVVLNSGRRHFSDLGFRLLDPSYPLADPGPADAAAN